MTTAAPDGVLTAGDLLFGTQEKAQEALTKHVMADGRAFFLASAAPAVERRRLNSPSLLRPSWRCSSLFCK